MLRIETFKAASTFFDRNKAALAPYINAALCLWFLVIATLLVQQVALHEMWRDELQAWVIARDSSSIGELFHSLSFEGFPPLWHILLKIVQVFSHNPASMQVTHVAIAILNLFLIWRYVPAPAPIKFILMISYPLSVQYALFSRCYSLIVTFILCALIAADKKRSTIYWLMLGLAGQTTILGICVASGLALHRLMEMPKETLKQWRGVSIFAGLTLFALLVAMPNPDRPHVQYYGQPTVMEFMVKTCSLLAPDYILSLPLFLGFATIAVLIIMALAINLRAIAAFAAMVISFLIIHKFGYPLAPYHLMLIPLGLAFIAIQSSAFRKWWATAACFVLLSTMAVRGAIGIWTIPAIPYSQGHNVAQWIEREGLKDAFWIALPDYTGATIVGFLDRPFYYPQCNCVAMAPHWSQKNKLVMSFDDGLAISENAMRERNISEAWFLVGATPWALPKTIKPPNGIIVTLVSTFTGAQVKDEQYIIYKLNLTDG